MDTRHCLHKRPVLLHSGDTWFTPGISERIWPLFGMSNQLLAACALIVGTTMIMGMGKMKYSWITAVPGILMLPVTMTAGYYLVLSNFNQGKYLLAALAASLMTYDGDRFRPGLQEMVSDRAGAAEGHRKDDANRLIKIDKTPARSLWLRAGAASRAVGPARCPESLISCLIQGRVGKSRALPTTDWWAHKACPPYEIYETNL